MEKIILLGCGGHAKSVLDSIEASRKYEIVGFTGTKADEGFKYRGYGVVGSDDDLESIYNSGVTNAFICVGFLGEGKLRNKLYELICGIGFNIPAIIDETAAVASDAVIGEGTFIGKNAVVNSAARIGKMTIINSSAVVEHDCTVGDYSHIAVGTVLCGMVETGENTFIGAGTVVIQEKTIGNGVIIGAGSTVIRNVPDSEKVMGLVK